VNEQDTAACGHRLRRIFDFQRILHVLKTNWDGLKY
jgi:hypothetical protein